MIVHLPYYKGRLEFTVDDSLLNGVYESSLPAPADERHCVADALDNPVGSPRLEELARGKRSALVITSDHTRPVPSRMIMPQILERLRAGQPGIDITILVATGLHRSSTATELEEKLGTEITGNVKIAVHDASSPEALADMGALPSGNRLLLNRLVAESDLVVAEGFIEPHFFAGFSGGRKSILPGVASRSNIFANHCSANIYSPYARAGNLEGNPVHMEMAAAADMAGLAFIVNVVVDGGKRIVHAVAGAHRAAHEEGCRWLASHCMLKIPKADIVVTSNGGYPMDQNIYQAVKGMSSAEAACRDGGCIVIAASCCDGTGGQAFYESLAHAATPEELTARIMATPRDGTVPDQWQYQILARILERHSVILVTSHCPHDIIRSMHITPASSMEEAMALAMAMTGPRPRINVIPDGVSVAVEPV